MVRRSLVSVVLAALWFVTMVGGWPDLIDDASARVRSQADYAEMLVSTLVVGGDEFNLPTNMIVHGGELYVLDNFRDYQVVRIDRLTGAIKGSFGPKGQGPKELASPISLIVVGSEIAVLDVGINRITWFEFNQGEQEYEVARLSHIGLTSLVTDLAPTAGDRLLAAGFLGARRLAYLDLDGGFVGHVGAPEEVDDLTPQRRSEVFQGTVRSDPRRKRQVITSRFASRLRVLDSGSAEPREFWGPRKFAPKPGRYQTRFGYLDSAPMLNGFLALYSGRTNEEFPGRANYASTIHEFGWDGELRAEYGLDSDVITIAWSEEDRLLYAVRHDPEPAIIVYDLSAGTH